LENVAKDDSQLDDTVFSRQTWMARETPEQKEPNAVDLPEAFLTLPPRADPGVV
jgi:hypothetical protein